jgi:hypothetical protein
MVALLQVFAQQLLITVHSLRNATIIDYCLAHIGWHVLGATVAMSEATVTMSELLCAQVHQKAAAEERSCQKSFKLPWLSVCTLLVGLGRGGQQLQNCRKSYQKAVEVLATLANLQTAFYTLDEALKVSISDLCLCWMRCCVRLGG